MATAAAAVIGRTVSDAYPDIMRKTKWSATAKPLNNGRVSPMIKRSLLVLFAAVGLVLALAVHPVNPGSIDGCESAIVVALSGVPRSRFGL